MQSRQASSRLVEGLWGAICMLKHADWPHSVISTLRLRPQLDSTKKPGRKLAFFRAFLLSLLSLSLATYDSRFEPSVRFELTTHGLQNRCSTN